ncbi:MAG: DsrE family protein [Carnobacterium sp.]|uniref:DsrE family protein n=1 Tax=Carnobacterium antarcticum TaxID=2126436 RepID=A0ABW4NJV3_9LACT|nr:MULTISPECIES: DsrE family protein [unclassified Carnobacterium]ALV21144.1 hypothetical protein NY10_526 [Carnobacterium sp. CP1]QQP71282.1 DsrE family protein [Carnobacterium sp. CS13]
MADVILHIDELEKWSLVLGNVRNLKKAQASLKIEVVANAAAVKGYLDSVLLEEIKPLIEQHVWFVACNNALRAHEIKENDLAPEIKIVPSGVMELVVQQQAGAAYVKP